jgi:hypothetical protein
LPALKALRLHGTPAAPVYKARNLFPFYGGAPATRSIIENYVFAPGFRFQRHKSKGGSKRGRHLAQNANAFTLPAACASA